MHLLGYRLRSRVVQVELQVQLIYRFISVSDI